MSSRPLLRSLHPQRIFRWVPEFVRLGGQMRSRMRLLGASMLVGVVAGIGAVAFYVATRAVWTHALGGLVGYRPSPQPGGEPEIAWLEPPVTFFRPWLLLVVPSLGGVLSGLLVSKLAPEAEGHGTDAVIAAYHQRDGSIRPRVPLVKIVASALTIGTGGSGGREGPIAQIGAGFGSFLAGALRMPPADRRVLCAAGMGAGIAAVFRAPLAGALFAAEVLYWSPEFEPEVIIPAGIASVVSYCTFGAIFGWRPLFSMPEATFSDPWQLAPYLLLALFMVLLAAIFTRTFHAMTSRFSRSRLPRWLRPAVGAGLSGLAGLVLYGIFGDQQVLSVLSFGYGALQGALNRQLGLGVAALLAIAFGKILTTSLTIGSGGSGGVFGPSMVIGGCGGGALGLVLHRFWPHLVPNPATFVIVGMAGFFAAAAKTPFSTLVIVSEMTGGYHLLLPALWVCVLAFMLSDRQSLYESQLETRSRSPAHRGTLVRVLLDGARVRALLKTPVPLLRGNEPLETVVEKLRGSRFGVLPVVDDEDKLLGVVDLEEVLTALPSVARGLVIAADLVRDDFTPLLLDDPLDTAQRHFMEHDLLALPVVNSLEDRRVLGMVKRFDVAITYAGAAAAEVKSGAGDAAVQ